MWYLTVTNTREWHHIAAQFGDPLRMLTDRSSTGFLSLAFSPTACSSF